MRMTLSYSAFFQQGRLSFSIGESALNKLSKKSRCRGSAVEVTSTVAPVEALRVGEVIGQNCSSSEIVVIIREKEVSELSEQVSSLRPTILEKSHWDIRSIVYNVLGHGYYISNILMAYTSEDLMCCHD
jgi:hypothetical protein